MLRFYIAILGIHIKKVGFMWPLRSITDPLPDDHGMKPMLKRVDS
jgi:hypothetical protein